MTVNYEKDVEALVEQFQRGEWREMHLTIGDINLYLSKDADAVPPGRGGAVAAAPAQSAPVAAPHASAPAAAHGGARSATAVPPAPPGWITVKAPSLGTFYRAPKPGAPPFTDHGSSVVPGADLCLIEVMKLFTSLKADTAGTVREIYVQDGELVEFDQPLFLIEPAA